MATNPPSDLSLNEYWDEAPGVLIRDFKGFLYSFPTGTYNNGTGGEEKRANQRYTFANGRSFGSGISSNDGKLNGEPWSSTKRVNDGNYSDNQGSSISPYRSDNANNYDNITTLNTFPTPPGYDKRSSGSGDDKGKNTSGYLIAEVDNYDNFHFAVYTIKRNKKDFLNDLISNAPNDKKIVLRQMAAKDCSNGNQRWNANGTGVGTDFCDVACDGGNDTKDACYNGNVQWCIDDSLRIGKTFGEVVNISTHEKCRTPLKDGKFDDKLESWCKTPANINSKWCSDIRKNVGTDSIKTDLDTYLYGTICASDANIGKNDCLEVRNFCNDTAQLLNDTEPYNCRSLVKELKEDDNIISITSKMDLSKVPVERRTEMLEYFNKQSTNAVEDALCSIAGNASDAACQTYLNNNFSGLIKTDTKNPILLMYFNEGTNFETKAGMDAWNNLKITFRNDVNSKIGLTSKQITLGAKWSAKLYTYITPSTTTDYIFKVSTGDYCKVYLNNTLIINNTTFSSSEIKTINPTYSTYINLDSNKGPYLLYVEYGSISGKSNLEITYTTKAIVGTGKIDAAIYSGPVVLPTGIPLFGTSPITGNGIVANSLYMSPFNPYTLVSNSRKIQSITYCSTNNRFATDDNCRGTSSNGYKAINSTYVTSDPVFKKAMTDYCAKDNNFSTDVFCIGDVNLDNDYSNGINKNSIVYDSANTSINTAINNYCKDEINNTYATAGAQWCKKNDNLNNTNYKKPLLQSLNPSYAATLRNTRLKYIQDAIETSIKTGGVLSQDVIDYITTDYLTLQNNVGAKLYPDSNIVTSDLTLFCENSDPTLKSGLCNSVYTKYKNNFYISTSQDRINDYANCIANNAFMGKSTNANFNKTCIAKRDAPATYARYLPLAIQYCGTGDNIVSPECTSYYNNIQGNINNAMNSNYTNAASNPTKSSFSNKEDFVGDNCEDIYDNNENLDYTYLLILFICFVLVLCCYSSYSNCQKNKHYKELMPFATVVQTQKQ